MLQHDIDAVQLGQGHIGVVIGRIAQTMADHVVHNFLHEFGDPLPGKLVQDLFGQVREQFLRCALIEFFDLSRSFAHELGNLPGNFVHLLPECGKLLLKLLDALFGDFALFGQGLELLDRDGLAVDNRQDHRRGHLARLHRDQGELFLRQTLFKGVRDRLGLPLHLFANRLAMGCIRFRLQRAPQPAGHESTELLASVRETSQPGQARAKSGAVDRGV